MSKYKAVIKGNNKGLFKSKIKGDFNLMLCAMAQLLCEMAIENNMPKESFLNSIKNIYNLTKKQKENENE